MNPAARLGIYALGLALAFGASAAIANAVVPDSAVDSWTKSVQENDMDHGERMSEGEEMGMESEAGEGHGGHEAEAASTGVRGLGIAQDGYLLSPVDAPAKVGRPGPLSFSILTDDGSPLSDYVESHEKRLHLIVVRADGDEFRHVHPEFAEGTWSIPWTWREPGSYRIFADFVPADTGEPEDAPDVTLSRTVDVAGRFEPSPATSTSIVSRVEGYKVRLDGALAVGASSALTVSVSRDGEPVTTLEPYLGAFGHLVALRDGDLAYLHVHPEGDEPQAGEKSGPDVVFMTEAPTPGRYLLYLDFKVDGEVHTARFVVDTTGEALDPDDDGGDDGGDSHEEEH